MTAVPTGSLLFSDNFSNLSAKKAFLGVEDRMVHRFGYSGKAPHHKNLHLVCRHGVYVCQLQAASTKGKAMLASWMTLIFHFKCLSPTVLITAFKTVS